MYLIPPQTLHLCCYLQLLYVFIGSLKLLSNLVPEDSIVTELLVKSTTLDTLK